MNGTKPPWASKTVWSAVGQLVILVLTYFFAIEMDAETKQMVVDQTVAIGAAVGVIVMAVLTIWGRMKAKATVTLKKPPNNPKLPK